MKPAIVEQKCSDTYRVLGGGGMGALWANCYNEQILIATHNGMYLQLYLSRSSAREARLRSTMGK